jgi:hypothetical protein
MNSVSTHLLPQYHELTVDTDGIEGDVDAHNTIFGGQAKMIREIHRNKFGKRIKVHIVIASDYPSCRKGKRSNILP